MKYFPRILLLLLLVSCKQETYYNITTHIQPEGSGAIVVSPSSGSVLEGTSVSFTAKPNGEYLFTGWSGSFSGTENPKTVTVSANMDVTANFELKTYPLTVSVEGDGSVSERVVSTKADFGSGTVVELTAQPTDHWLFDHWEGDLSGNTNPAQITVTSAKSVKAVFVKKMYDLTVTVEGDGAVSEAVIDTKSGSYQEGTVVQLTATPSTGWSFDHWEGDLSGTENPTQITISGVKSVKAVFLKDNYHIYIDVVGPGVVNENVQNIQDTKSGYPFGTAIQLVAIPDKYDGTEFSGWRGDLNGDDLNVTFSLEKDTHITAIFTKQVNKYSQPNLKSPWITQKRLYSGVDFTGFSNDGADIITLDYNGDGYVDVVTTVTEDGITFNDCPVRFFLGNADGTFTPDPVNDGKFIAEDPRKIMSCDFNNDGIPDIMTVGHGNEASDGPIEEYPVALLSKPDGSYYDVRFTESIGYYHGSSLGDFDNDGDVDIFLCDSRNKTSVFYINDGEGGFTPNTLIVPDTEQQYTCELYDFDKDGFLDLIMGHHVVWGNGVSFSDNEFTDFVTEDPFADCALDYDIYDLNGDGIEELIICMTDGAAYTCRCFQVVEINGRNFKDVTKEYFEGSDYIEKNTRPAGWVDIEEIDGKIYLVGRFVDNGERLYQLIDGRFVKINTIINPSDGIVLYYDRCEHIGSHWNPCTQQPYQGKTCIQFGEWTNWEAFYLFTNDDWIDFSSAESDGYCLEFAIKTYDPNLIVRFNFETILQTDPWYFPTYFYEYRAENHNSISQWEVIRIPLSDFQLEDDWKSGYYWNKIKNFYVSPRNYIGKDFYLDEIRIRKILPE